MPILNPPASPSQPCDHYPFRAHDEDVATTSDYEETASPISSGTSHWHRITSLNVLPHLNPSATEVPQALVSTGAPGGCGLQLRGGGLEASDAEPPSPSFKRKVSGGRDVGPYGISPPSIRTRQRSKDSSVGTRSPEVSTSHQSIQDYRAKLARDMERKAQGSPAENLENIRVSPIREDLSVSSSSVSDLPTASTESNKTVRGGMTPGFAARTPSYPFPRMHTPGFRHSHLQHHFSPFEGRILYDQLTSDPSTPASAMTFLPPGCTPFSEDPNYPTPNLYELSLMLSAEPGLNDWWNTVVQIMTEVYKAERITLSVPADATDIDNVPWGQKATYNAQAEDEYSMAYIGRGSSLTANSAGDRTEVLSATEPTPGSEHSLRPNIQSRHSFTAYEEKRESRRIQFSEATASPTTRRPGLTSRSKSHFPGADRGGIVTSHTALNQQALEEHDAVEEQQHLPSWEATIEPERALKGQVLPVLQALDLDADPLIDHNGITRVIERGKVIALTRTYPYLDPGADEHSTKAKSPKPMPQEAKIKGSTKQTKSENATNLSSLLANASAPLTKNKSRKSTVPEKSKIPHLYSVIDDEPPRPPTPKFEEFEQAPPSPWSQSPAPSPAVRADPTENPFFTDAAVLDEGSFNPGPSPHDYTSVQAPETIGVDNSWTVLHIPLNHILLSRSPQRFKLDPSVLEQKTNLRAKHEAYRSPLVAPDEPPRKQQQPPIAILSILSPVIPYPSNLRYSLEHLAPHLATSFSLCRHYTNLETEVMGLSRKRPSNVGFGAIGPDGRPIANLSALGPLGLSSEDASQRSIAGSLTSPSDYSTQSRSITGSPMGTPLWEPGSFGLVVERRVTGTSPGSAGGDSYFNPKPRGGTRAETPPGISSHRASRNSKESTTNRPHRQSASSRKHQEPLQTKDSEIPEAATTEEDATPVLRPRHVSKESASSSSLKEEPHGQDVTDHPKRRAANAAQSGHKHTKLHSYGGDFAATFQSLPPSTPLLTKPTTSTPTRSGSMPTTQVSMNPPTDRLKGLMLDLLPVQVFVAWPVTGEIVWVNSRYLTYRGQTLADLISDPWASFHEEDREDYLRNWTHSLRTGEQFVHTVRLRRFDGAYRWHQARAVASRDKRGVIVQFIGSYMDIHDQKVAEFMALRQAEVEASEAKHRLLANLIPQIIFTATESDGITFANEQWLAYTGQSEDGPLGNGFMDFVHPEDLARCRVPIDRSMIPKVEKKPTSSSTSTITSELVPMVALEGQSLQNLSKSLSAASQDESTSSNAQASSLPNADLSELAKKGIIKVATDSNGRLSYTTELRLRSKTGEYRWHLIRCVEIDDVGFGSGPSSYFGSATDINDHKLLEAKLKEAMESKGRFLSNMSHEIRTPLIGISGMVSFLQDTTLSEEQRDFTNTIQTSANSLLMIINDILDLSKVDAGMMKLKFEWFHTRSLIEDVNELVSTMAIAKRLELNYIVEENVPAWVKGDKFRIRQVLLNVIGNAIKFTTEGEVFSRCRVYTEYAGELGENQIMLEYSVIDTGRGFSEEEAGLIFKPFSQIDGSSTRQHGGSGLGLVISRQLVELHGGQMDGKAVPGKGSTFTFTARFDLPNAADHPEVTTTPPMGATATPPGEHNASMQAIKPLMLQKTLEQPMAASPSSDAGVTSPALASSGSSDPSIRSVHTQHTTTSSVSSVNVGLVHFSEAAKASGQDLSQMKFEMPMGRLSLQTLPVTDNNTLPNLQQSRLPMYSILIICPQKYSREAITKHIEMTLPKYVPRQITARSSLLEAQSLIGGDEAVTFTHVVVNLASAEEIVDVTTQTIASSAGRTITLIMSDSLQRQAVLDLASKTGHSQLLADKKIIFVHKPVKPSRFAVIFDPARERDVSTDLNRSSAAQMVESQKQSYLDVEKRIGAKGVKVLLVEDNPVNQKVLSRYLKKVGIEAEIAADGMEATEMVFARTPMYYSLILCDLHMPRKDGYQTCQDIRRWERENNYSPTPVIALSANVMSDVQEKCIAAGFDDFVTKPVDFVDLSAAMSKHF
ncbi:hsp90-like protein [Xylaria bambusicola]|uniref:hsp90-like protein n=1 Tax=Xylaria bambusicola TaxID=326684 RepID=UPI00200876AF|nr:hsp90-like protein [Xylaria bambusicola]KAI0518186.1 hsp90-like protein [Xylaria bambusicola]